MFSNVWKYSLFAFLAIGMVAVSPVWADDDDEKLPQNIILLIGDGLGEHHVQAAGLFRFGDQYRSNDETRFEWEKFPFLKGDVYPKAIFVPDSSIRFPDSAATATTMATGVITQNRRISMDETGTVELETLLEFYRDRGKATGLVTTSRMPHATPATFGAHDPDRGNETDIARDYLNETKPNLLLGGDARLPESQSEIEGGGYTYIDNRADLLSEAAKSFDFDNSVLIWGEFTTGSHMGYEADDAFFKTKTFYDMDPHLSEMAQAALDILSQDMDGFFLMIEGARIDHAAHDASDTRREPDDAYITELYEILEFNNAVKKVVDWLEDQPKGVRNNTIIVVTADHETGLLTILEDLYAEPHDGCDIFDPGVDVPNDCEFPIVDYLTGEFLSGSAFLKNHSDHNVPLYVRGPNSSSALFARDQIDVHKILKGERIGPKMEIKKDDDDDDDDD